MTMTENDEKKKECMDCGKTINAVYSDDTREKCNECQEWDELMGELDSR